MFFCSRIEISSTDIKLFCKTIKETITNVELLTKVDKGNIIIATDRTTQTEQQIKKALKKETTLLLIQSKPVS